MTSGTFIVSGLSRVQCGFSFPVPNAPCQYDVAMEAAVAAHCGVLEIGPSMAAQEAMPWSLKETFSSGQTAVALPGSSCLITNSPQFLNESHLCIHGSFIAGAGQFLEKNENEIEGRLTKIEKALDAQKDEDTKNKWTATCRKARREVEGLHDELKKEIGSDHPQTQKWRSVSGGLSETQDQAPPLLSGAAHKPNNQIPKAPNCPAQHTSPKTKLKKCKHHPDYPVTVTKATHIQTRTTGLPSCPSSYPPLMNLWT